MAGPPVHANLALHACGARSPIIDSGAQGPDQRTRFGGSTDMRADLAARACGPGGPDLGHTLDMRQLSASLRVNGRPARVHANLALHA